MAFFLKSLQKPLQVYILLLCCLISICHGLTADGEALVNFRTSIINSDDVLGQWRPEDPDPCGWKGVTCDSTKRVISLNVSNHKLKGPLSPDIGKLDQLKFLYVILKSS
ncbi:putative non-specific serine/threonine protein kinase [Helianthus annuus]|nr:putative non-specific serine/threonine protein kinase [Helianthus annuus]